MRRFVAFGLLLVLFGCAGSPPQVPCHPVRGELFHKGKPAAGAEVTLVPTDPALASSLPIQPHAEVGPDGSFVIATYAAGDGAPAGDYKLVFRWKKPNPEDEESTTELLPDHLADPAQSSHLFTVKPGENTIPRIDLKK